MKKIQNLTRRKFMAMSSAAMAAPILKNMGNMVPQAKAAERQYDFFDKRSCDLVVLGGGGSGLVAAVRAAQLSGKKVIVLEKDSTAGGGAQGATTIRTFGSKWQAKRNIPDTTAEYAHEMMNWMYWWLDEKLVNNCLRGTGQFFDWLCEQGGDIEDKFTAAKYTFALSEYDPVGPRMTGFGKFVMDMMQDKCLKYGVELLTKHPVVDVEVNNGKIVAAIAKSDNGYVRVSCKACILATGSWINNEEITKKYVPNFAAAKPYMGDQLGLMGGQGGSGAQGNRAGAQGKVPAVQGGQGGAPGAQGSPQGGVRSNVGHTSSNYTGDGIALAEKVGAFVDYDSFCVRPMGPLSTGVGSQVFKAMAQSPYIVSVNLNGKRYCSEPVIINLGFFNGGSVLIQQPRGQSWDIFDENTIAATFKLQKSPQAVKKTEKLVELTPNYKTSLPDTMEEIQSDIKKNLATDSITMFKADTLEELADKIGVNKKNFIETIKRYNESCEKGVDQDCFKSKDNLEPINKPPYYASRGSLLTDGAFGGVRVNPEMQAYKSDRTSLVEGLYITGDFATGRHINVRGVKWQVINDLSWALSSGFLAGTNVAKYLKSIG